MSLIEGAETVVNQCLQVQDDETVLVLNDGNDQDLIDALIQVLDQKNIEHKLLEYEEPDNHGEEPPSHVAEQMKRFDVVIAPTNKSLSHTEARREACETGTRVATMPTVNKQVWNESLQADYSRVKELSEKVYELLEDVSEIRIKTPSGTDLTLKVDREFFHRETGVIDKPGMFSNLPAGEADGGVLDANGKLVIDHFPFAPKGTEVEIKNGEAVSVKHPDSSELDLAEAFEDVKGARKVAEFGFGTNPKASLIGNVLQDEKVFGTVHIAFGDNTSYIPGEIEGHNPCDIHWDTVCENPTVWFDDEKVLDEGEPVFL